MPRYSNPRRQRQGFSISLPQVLRWIAFLTGFVGLAVAALFIIGARPEGELDAWNSALLWTAAQIGIVSLAGGLLWYVIAQVVQRLNEIRDGIEQLVEEDQA